MSAFLTPIVGIGVDFLGRRADLLYFSSSVMLTAHVLWTTLPQCPCLDFD